MAFGEGEEAKFKRIQIVLTIYFTGAEEGGIV